MGLIRELPAACDEIKIYAENLSSANYELRAAKDEFRAAKDEC